MLSGFFQNQASTSDTLPSNTIPNPKGEMKAITTRSGVAYEGPSIPTPKKVVKRETKETTDKEQTNFQGSAAHIQPPVTPILEPDLLKILPKPNIPYPSRLNDQKLRENATNQMEKFFQIFQDLHFDISFADALLLMPKFASMIKSLHTNMDKMPFGLCNAPGTFQRFMMAIFLDMIEKTMEDFMDDFLVFGDSFSSCLSHLDTMLQRFIQDFSKIARPMTHLLEKETPFVLSKDCIDAFETLKKKLTEASILVVPDWNLPFELMCDASDIAIGAVLGQ
nr:reverse transcriptase domain-containing protein [Tanacetum cinerariifolium]GEX00396.1 reverse transcriptase domain-containing protein [Tanacetum cinerariifolium]